jgi:hypothetical protein
MPEEASLTVTIEPELEYVPSLTLHDWIQRDHEYRGIFRSRRRSPKSGQMGAAEVILVGVLTQSTVLGLLRLIRVWLESQRGSARVHVKVDSADIDVQLAGRFDPERVAAELLDQALSDPHARTDDDHSSGNP